jgi:hypothetical protein
MKSKTGWILAIVLGLILLLLVPGLFMMGRWWLGGYGGMMGYPGMMGWGYSYMHPFGWAGMLLGWLIPLGAVVLVVVGAVALINNLNRPGPAMPLVPERKCSNCGRPAQPDWMTCPYCGKALP